MGGRPKSRPCPDVIIDCPVRQCTCPSHLWISAFVRLGRLKYNAAQLTSNHGVDSLPAKIFIRGVFHCNIIPTGSKYANSGFSSPVFYFSSFFSISLLTFLSPFISLPISLSATFHQYVAYSMPLKSPGVNAYHLSKHVVLPQT